jgi:ATP-dependent RNA helicase DDX3X
MADNLNMNGLSLGAGDARSAPGASSYIPPHMRGKVGGPAPTNGAPPAGINGSAWAPPPGAA